MNYFYIFVALDSLILALSLNLAHVVTPRRMRLSMASSRYSGLEKTLKKEYASFFSPMERQFYAEDVTFVDPLTSFTGIDKYQNNVDMLAGRTSLGRILFDDANIVLHNIKDLGENRIQTRWTLQVNVKFLPWKPRAKFTGVSIYTVSGEPGSEKVVRQEDYWDSVNLKGGKYQAMGFVDGLSDFLGQIFDNPDSGGAEMAAPELPYELLRRHPMYDVKRYPNALVAQTKYSQRPEGYDRLGSYAGGSNVREERVTFFTPTLMSITDSDGGKREKRMTWPLKFNIPGEPLPSVDSLPEPTINNVNLFDTSTNPRGPFGRTYAILRFEKAATEEMVRGFTRELLRDITADGLKPVESQNSVQGDCLVAQFDALFSLNKRRNEIWIELESHDWEE
jgi:hypothetical protein